MGGLTRADSPARMKRGRSPFAGRALMAFVCMACCGFPFATRSVQVNQVINWPAGHAEGWRLEDAGAPPGEPGDRSDLLVFLEGSIGWSPSPSDPPAAVRYWLEPGSLASGGAFHGDYFDSGVSVLMFDFFAAHASLLEVELRREADFVFYTASIDLQSGWQRVEIPLTSEYFELHPFSMPMPFRTLLQQVDQLAFGVRPGSLLEGQIFRLRNVTLQGSGAGYTDWVAPFEAAHGGASEQWLPGADRSGNGVPNAHAFVAGLNPADPLDVFRVKALQHSPVHRISWASALGRQYTVLRTDSLNVPDFAPVPGFEAIPGTGSDITMQIEPSGSSGLSIYRVHVELTP